VNTVPPTKPVPVELGPPWYEVAKREIGIREVLGTGINPRIAEYYKATNIGRVNDDAVPWCSAFANWCLVTAGMKGTNSAAARSWLLWGVPLVEPKLGAICVFERPPNPASGHVAFYCGVVEKRNGTKDLLVLGGNQGNQVCVTAYARGRLVGFRWPSPRDIKPIVPSAIGPAAPPPMPVKK
jgi:uncharacterized protein (TIGR02594 family)